MSEHIGKYCVKSVLGKGSMGVVYKAYDPHIARDVALKTIRKELLQEGQGEELIARFKNEAQASGRLTHPNIVAVYDYGETADTAFIAMEYVEGTALNTLLAPGQPVDLKRVMVWMSQLLQGLGYAHAHGVVHRDIKPANLIITVGGDLKITDFGIARTESSELTQTGSMVGTPSYMSPEQFRGAAIDGRSDLFSAGIVLYQLLTGVRPFNGSASVVMQQILNEPAVAPSRVNPALGVVFDELLQRALAKRAADRYEGASGFLDALMLAHEDSGRRLHAHALTPTFSDNDRTILASQIRDVSGSYLQPAPDSGGSSAPTAGGSPGARATDAPGTHTPWKIEVFPQLEAALARQIGPIAKLLLKKAGAKANDIRDLEALLLPHIPSESGKAAFQQTVASLTKARLAVSLRTAQTTATILPGDSAHGTHSTATLRSRTVSNEQPLSVEQIAAYEKVLNRYIGAIGKIVVKRSIAKTSRKNEFVRMIADSIESLSARARFYEEIDRL